MATNEETKAVIAKGSEYHDLIAQFLKEHPDLNKVVDEEMDYLAYIMMKAVTSNLVFGALLEAPGCMLSFKESLVTAFMQGYYRAYQNLKLEKL